MGGTSDPIGSQPAAHENVALTETRLRLARGGPRPVVISDGIHFTTPGYRERSHRIALALARAFPKDRPPAADCVVRSELG